MLYELEIKDINYMYKTTVTTSVKCKQLSVYEIWLVINTYLHVDDWKKSDKINAVAIQFKMQFNATVR